MDRTSTVIPAFFALLLALVAMSPAAESFLVIPQSATFPTQRQGRGGATTSSECGALHAAPKEALRDIVIPNIFEFASALGDSGSSEEEDPRIWVPQTDCLSFRPLCLCVSQGYYVNLLKFKGGGILGRHRHSSPVHALTLKGGWGYKEHGWHADPGTYVFEPPGETHTLTLDEDCDEMITLFHVTGTLVYENDDGQMTGYDDVFTKLEKAKKWYNECGLGEDYVQQFVR
jgi:2,4'-dihydroxyacetophenone dioxygenase